MYTFDNARREITFDRYNTPTPWMNYLSNGVFHTMISHCGGGVAFYKSPQIWRINHYRFFHLPTDRSGFLYLYQRRKRRLDANERTLPHKAGTVALHPRNGLYAL